MTEAIENSVQPVMEHVASTIAEHAGEAAHVAHVAHGHGPFYHDPTFWVSISFAIVIIALAKPIGGLLKSMIIKRADNIKKSLEEAKELKEQAQELLAEYEKKQRGAEEEAKKIIAKAEAYADSLKKEATMQLEASMAKKEQDALNKIKQAEKDALQEVSTMAVKISIEAVAKYIEENSKDLDIDKLVEGAISELPDKLKQEQIN